VSVSPPSGTAPEVGRTSRLGALVRDRGADLLLITNPVNLRYLTGFSGSNGLALIAAGREGEEEGGEGGADPHLFLTDFRYETQSAEQVPALFERRIVPVDLVEAAVAELAQRAQGGRLGFEEGSLTVKQHLRLRELLPAEWEPIACGGLVEELREVKEPAELARIRAACELADEALREVLEAGVIGRTEREVAIDLELRMRRLGAQAPSFPSIVAAGSQSALPHAEPREVAIPRDTLLTIDWGALHGGYCSDCTRTYATGERLPEGAREVYELVLAAQLAGLAAVRPGPSGREVDAVAREVIERASRSTRAPASPAPPASSPCAPATCSPSSPASTSRAVSGCASRICSCSVRAARSCSRGCPRSSPSSPERVCWEPRRPA
jgi:Xaa-Pro aminopeptidase